MKKSDIVGQIINARALREPVQARGAAFAPTNIALCKYWGKRDTELNLPMTSSLSVALPGKGSHTVLTLRGANDDRVILNGKTLPADSAFVKRLCDFLDLFREKKSWHLQVDITMNIPVAAGLASSACGFASLVSALNDLFGWALPARELSILARLGSGSASRSLWNGFVMWHAGARPDGMDSYAEPLKAEWRDMRVGILSIATREKPVSSREAMRQTVETSLLYARWPETVARDMLLLKSALQDKNFSLLGRTAESNALTMHATLLSSWPPVCYHLPETIAAMHKIWDMRREGEEIYFTQDAGPNLKLLFLEKDTDRIVERFPEAEIISLSI
ncbi:hypothetical protein AQUSIP_18590 [Aquicella siphonis]|uniref:diphosphomevalonate decarboxylase n=1 Tax=Aquicella siphonis TaxID=254247 RepID=A0A5E4PJE4_9COXI|nr:diphosphomevalonate decarboxylase [Aquicella siphonis]VVC76543.1 hypothetical protein AQUSIP_18590 [Aquicella siphonis]